ncbi:MAG: DNA primase [Flavobacterium sp.]
MRRIIVDYAKLTNEILNLLVEKFPDGYEDSDIIKFRNAQNELIEAVEVKTHDTIYLVKVSKKLATRIENFDEDDDIGEVETIAPVKSIGLDDEIEEVDVDDEDATDDEEEEEIDLLKDVGGTEEEEDDDDDEEEEPIEEEDDDDDL